MWASAFRWGRRPSRRPDRFASLWVGLALLGGCRSNEEAVRVLDRVDRMRDARLEERANAIAALAALTPTHPGAARAQKLCLAAYQGLQRAHEQTAAIQARIDALAARGETPRFEEVSAADEAVTMMQEAQKAEPDCARAVADLRNELR